MSTEPPQGRPSHGIRRTAVWLAWLLDSSIPLPGIRFRIGLDPIIGLIPGLGDAVGALAATYLMREAARLGAPRTVLMRMAFNVAVDALFGIFPVAGNVFDAVWKANRRNLALLEAHMADPRRTARSSTAFVTFVAVLMILLIVGVTVLGVLVVRALWQAVT
jgi:hypothetical protein